jgi:hypothetical protein
MGRPKSVPDRWAYRDRHQHGITLHAPHSAEPENALFVGHGAGAQNWALLGPIIETCKLNIVEPHAYLIGVLTAIARGHQKKDIASYPRGALESDAPLTQNRS